MVRLNEGYDGGLVLDDVGKFFTLGLRGQGSCNERDCLGQALFGEKLRRPRDDLIGQCDRSRPPQFETTVEWVDTKNNGCTLLLSRDTIRGDIRSTTELANRDHDLVTRRALRIVDSLRNGGLL